MTREIKLRFWDISGKHWINAFKITVNADGSILDVLDLEGNLYYIHNIIVSQFTDLHDNNKQPIFEGDILAFADKRYTDKWLVKWHQHICAFILQKLNDKPQDDCNYYLYKERDKLYRVIGTIYENPELQEGY